MNSLNGAAGYGILLGVTAAPVSISGRRLPLARTFGAVLVTLALLAALPAPASANTPVPGAATLAMLADAAAPHWNFARALDHDTCWPGAALTASGAQATPATLKGYPVTGQGGCANAGTGFPTYATAASCTGTEVRVAYTLYFPKDGFAGNVLGIADLGHQHDFEQVVVVWTQSGGTWTRDRLLMSRHGNFISAAWASVRGWDAARTATGLGLDHPDVFVGWAKHAMFNSAGGLVDLVSQYTDEEFRSSAYSAWPGAFGSSTLLDVEPGGALAAQFDAADWGSATSTPSVIATTLCTL